MGWVVWPWGTGVGADPGIGVDAGVGVACARAWAERAPGAAMRRAAAIAALPFRIEIKLLIPELLCHPLYAFAPDLFR